MPPGRLYVQPSGDRWQDKNREIIYYVNKDAASFVPPEVTSDSLDGASGYDVLYVSYSPFLGGSFSKKLFRICARGGHVG